MTMPILYAPDANLYHRFINHARLGLSKEIEPHKVTVTELFGDMILWTVVDLPNLVWEKISDARVMAIALTVLSLLANSFLFYPLRTFLKLRSICKNLLPPFWAVRFASYIFTSALILGYGLRALGRFSNPELMNRFYHPATKA